MASNEAQDDFIVMRVQAGPSSRLSFMTLSLFSNPSSLLALESPAFLAFGCRAQPDDDN
jgi:hypothetical protein